MPRSTKSSDDSAGRNGHRRAHRDAVDPLERHASKPPADASAVWPSRLAVPDDGCGFGHESVSLPLAFLDEFDRPGRSCGNGRPVRSVLLRTAARAPRVTAVIDRVTKLAYLA